MTPDVKTIAHALGRTYGIMLQVLTGIFAVAIDVPNPASTIVRKQMMSRATLTTNSYLHQFDEDIADAATSVVAHAVIDAGVKDVMGHAQQAELNAYTQSVAAEQIIKMRSVLANNLATLANELRRLALSTSLLQSTTGITRFGALIKTRFGKVSNLRFAVVNGRGRKYNAQEYVATLLQQVLLQLYVEAFLYCAVLQGDTHARITYKEADHPYNGVVFSIADDGTDLCFDKIKDAIWHPNSTAGVERVHA